MNAQAISLFDEPRARATDPITSDLAALSIVPRAQDDLQLYIRRALERCGPLTQEQIAIEVGNAQPGRWKHGTIVSARAPRRSGLQVWDYEKNADGHTVAVWSLTAPPILKVEVTGDIL